MSNTRESTQARATRAAAARSRATAGGLPAARQTRPAKATITELGSAKDDVLTYNGQTYQLADKIGVWPMMQLARAAEQGLSSTDSKGLAALHAMFEDMIDPDDWPRFQEDMIAAKLDDPIKLLQTTQEAVNRVMERQAAQEAKRLAAQGEPGGSLDDEQQGGTRVPAGLRRRDYDIEP